MIETNPCPICHSDQIRLLFEGWDLFFGYPDTAFVYQCRKCDHVFVAGELTAEQLTDMYTNYYPRATFDLDHYKPHKEKKGFLFWLDGEEERAFRHVPENVRVLDIGCGYCETLGYHKARGCEVYGVDADENTRKIAEKFGFNVEIGLFDPKKYDSNFFDYVTMDHVLEHIVDPLKTLQDINGILKPGGKFIASMPNPFAFGRHWFGRYWVPWHLPFHRHFYTRKSLSLLAEQSGFVVESMHSATLSKCLFGNWLFLFSAGSKGKKIANVTERVQPIETRAQKRWDATIYLWLSKMRFLCLSMRIADLVGRGDHQLVVLKKQN
jgi:SAM-dependent methyltransferase